MIFVYSNCHGTMIWNKLPIETKNAIILNEFKRPEIHALELTVGPIFVTDRVVHTDWTEGQGITSTHFN